MADVGLTLTFEDRQLLDKMRELLTLMDQAEDQAVDTSEAMKNAFGSVAKAADAPQKGLNRIKGGLGEIARVAGGVIGADLFQGLVTGAGQAISELKDLAIEQDALSRKSKTVLGPSFNDIEEAAKSSAAALGLSTSEYVSNAAAVADILKPMGFYTDEAAQMAEQTIELSGALAEWTGGQLDAKQVSEILTKAYTGEREGLKQLGIVISENDVKNRLAAKGVENLTGKYLEQAKAAATLELITEKSTDAQKSFLENSDSLIRSQAELGARLTTISENISRTLTPVFAGLTKIASDFAGVVADITSDPVERLTSAYLDQRSEAERLESSLVPLLDRYDDLKEAAPDNVEQQGELKKVIQEIAEIMPSAVTQINEYGEALDINTQKVRDNIDEQNRRLQVTFDDAIDENTKALQRNRETLRGLTNEYNEYLRTGERADVRRRKSGAELEFYTVQVKVTERELADLRDRQRELNEEIENNIKNLESFGVDPIEFLSPEEVEKMKELRAEAAELERLREEAAAKAAAEAEARAKAEARRKEFLKVRENALKDLIKLSERLVAVEQRSDLNQLEGYEALEKKREIAIQQVEALRDSILETAKEAGQEVDLNIIKLPDGSDLDVGGLVESLFEDIDAEYKANVEKLEADLFAEKLAGFEKRKELRSDELDSVQSDYEDLLNEDEKYRVAKLSNDIRITNEQIKLLQERAEKIEDVEQRDQILRDITPLLRQVRAQQNEITKIITSAKIEQLDQERILGEKRVELLEEDENAILTLEERKQTARLELQKAFFQKQLAIIQATKGEDSFDAKNILLEIELIDKALKELGEDTDPAQGWLERLKSNLAEALGVTTDELDQLANQIGDAFDNIAAKQIENTERLIAQNERVIDSIQRRADSLERDLEREIEFAEAGLAYNVEIKKQELEIIRKQEDKALKDREKLEKQAARQRLIRDAAEQTSNLVSAATIIFKEGVSTFGIIGGLIAAGAAIISLFAAFKAVKQQAASATRLYKGGKLADHMKGERDHGLIKPGGSSDKPGAGKGYRIEGTNIIVGGNERVMSEGAVSKFDPILEAMEKPGASMDNLNEILSKVPSYDPDKHISKETVERISNINSTSQKFREQIIKEHDHVIKIESQEGKGIDKKIEKAVDKAVEKHIQRLIDFQKNRTERVVIPKDVDRIIEYKGSDKKIIRNP